MSGFLRQLASRGLGQASRLRSAPAPLAWAVQGAAARDAWAAETPAAAAARAGRVASAAGGGDARDVATHSRQTRSQQGGMSPLRGETAPARWEAGGNDDTAPAATDGRLAGPARRRLDAAASMPRAATADASPLAVLRRADERDTPMRDPALPITGEPDARRADNAGQEGSTTAKAVAARFAVRQRSWPPGDTGDAGETGGARDMNGAGGMNRTRGMNGTRGENGAGDTGDADGSARFDARFEARTARRAQDDSAPSPRTVPDVHITIDRLEVAPPAPIPRAAPAPRSAALSLRAYLAARRSGLP